MQILVQECGAHFDDKGDIVAKRDSKLTWSCRWRFQGLFIDCQPPCERRQREEGKRGEKGERGAVGVTSQWWKWQPHTTASLPNPPLSCVSAQTDWNREENGWNGEQGGAKHLKASTSQTTPKTRPPPTKLHTHSRGARTQQPCGFTLPEGRCIFSLRGFNRSAWQWER